MTGYRVDDIRGCSNEVGPWHLGEPGKIRSLDEVADTNAWLAMELMSILLDDSEKSADLHGKPVFHVIKGEGYFNEQNRRMAQRLMKNGVPFCVVTWTPVDNH